MNQKNFMLNLALFLRLFFLTMVVTGLTVEHLNLESQFLKTYFDERFMEVWIRGFLAFEAGFWALKYKHLKDSIEGAKKV